MKKINIPKHLVELILFFIVIALIVFFALQAFSQDTLLNNTGPEIQQGPGIFLIMALLVEAVARIIPTKWDISILSNLLRLIDKILPNRYREKTSDGQVKRGWFRVRHKLKETAS